MLSRLYLLPALVSSSSLFLSLCLFYFLSQFIFVLFRLARHDPASSFRPGLPRPVCRLPITMYVRTELNVVNTHSAQWPNSILYSWLRPKFRKFRSFGKGAATFAAAINSWVTFPISLTLPISHTAAHLIAVLVFDGGRERGVSVSTYGQRMLL